MEALLSDPDELPDPEELEDDPEELEELEPEELELEDPDEDEDEEPDLLLEDPEELLEESEVLLLLEESEVDPEEELEESEVLLLLSVEEEDELLAKAEPATRMVVNRSAEVIFMSRRGRLGILPRSPHPPLYTPFSQFAAFGKLHRIIRSSARSDWSIGLSCRGGRLDMDN